MERDAEGSSGAREVRLSAGVVRYRDTGGSGPPVVFVHGLFVDGRLWREVVGHLGPAVRCLVPDLPLGAHQVPMDPGADLSPAAVADLLAEFIDAVGLESATVVANDTGGAIAQMLAARHPERVNRLLLTPCDTYDNFLPPMFIYLQVCARVPGLLYAMLTPLRLRPLRRLPFAFGWLAKRGIPRELGDAWVRTVLDNRGSRRDAIKVLKGISKRELVETAAALEKFDRPVLLAFAPQDRFFKISHAERMVRELPDARLERIEDSFAFAPLDQPARVAGLVAGFAA